MNSLHPKGARNSNGQSSLDLRHLTQARVKQKERESEVYLSLVRDSMLRFWARRRASVMDVDEFEDPLPKLAYDTTNARRLREMLAEQGLPTNGDKPILAARHARSALL